jgi:hypothetical protein
MIKMPKVLDCTAEECAYNMRHICHAMAVTIGNGGCPLCDTAIKSSRKAGMRDIIAKVGACKVENCMHNDALECTADGIHVKIHIDHAECTTFKPK